MTSLQVSLNSEALFKKESLQINNELKDLKWAVDQSVMVSVTDLQGKITYINDMYLKVTKYSRDEVIGKNHRFFNSGYHLTEVFKDLWETITAGQIWRGEIRNKAKDGSFYWVDTTIIPFLRDKKPYQYMSIRNEISKKKLVETQLLEEKAKQHYIGRLAAVGQVTANIAHEIRNPLGAIRLQAQIMKRLDTSNTFTALRALKAFESIDSLTRRIEKIIDSIRMVCREGSADPLEVILLSKIVEDTLELCRSDLQEKSIKLHIDPIPEGLNIRCRHVQICQVLLNLIGNARDAVETLDERWIRLSFRNESGSLFIQVTDSGCGIKPEIKARLMEAFFSTKEPSKGTGLGLSISQKIVESHGGKLYLNEACPNTQFVLRLPVL